MDCWGITKSYKRCSNKATIGIYCGFHKYQPFKILWKLAVAFGVIWTIYQAVEYYSPEAKLCEFPESKLAQKEYSIGLSQLAERKAASFIRAENHFRKVISLEPNFSGGYARLAECYLLMHGY